MDDGDTECFLARDQVARQNAPGTLRVANSASARVRVNRHGKLNPFVENVPGQNLGKKYASRLAVRLAPGAIGNKSPALKKYPAPTLRLQISLCSLLRGGIPRLRTRPRGPLQARRNSARLLRAHAPGAATLRRAHELPPSVRRGF